MAASLGVRWTVGDVSPTGFEALGLSLHGAVRLFGPDASYCVCVNTVSVAEAKRLTGAAPPNVEWQQVRAQVPEVLAPHLDGRMAEGVAWKFSPLRLFPDMHELSLDNDVILWEMPQAMADWLQSGACLIAADVVCAHGQFADLSGAEPRNSGIRGLPPGFDLATALGEVLRRRPVRLTSELDEQGLQIAALSLAGRPLCVTTEEVSICSPFPPHRWEPGRCGAHFVGLNLRDIPWQVNGRPALEVRLEHWNALRGGIAEKLGCAGLLTAA